MDLFELIERLCKYSQSEIEFGLLAMLCKGKVDFLTLQNAYIRYLEEENMKRQAKLIEAEVCILEGFIHDRPGKSKESEVSVQRRLYFLNQSGRFNMKELNGKLKYDPDRAAGYNHEDETFRCLFKSTNMFS